MRRKKTPPQPREISRICQSRGDQKKGKQVIKHGCSCHSRQPLVLGLQDYVGLVNGSSISKGRIRYVRRFCKEETDEDHPPPETGSCKTCAMVYTAE